MDMEIDINPSEHQPERTDTVSQSLPPEKKQETEPRLKGILFMVLFLQLLTLGLVFFGVFLLISYRL